MTEEMLQSPEEQLRRFVETVGGGIVESTFYAKTTSGPSKLYNVRGSTPDPYPQKPTKVTGWKSLLLSQGIGAPCYASAPLPAPGKGKSHPGFDVGGHMTTAADGSVATGGSCYLVPLCSWHNGRYNTAQFTMRSTTMLVLSGYMQADTSATFLARLGGVAEHAVVYVSDDGPAYEYLAESPLEADHAPLLHGCKSEGLPAHHVVFRREEFEGRMVYRITHAATG